MTRLIHTTILAAALVLTAWAPAFAQATPEVPAIFNAYRVNPKSATNTTYDRGAMNFTLTAETIRDYYQRVYIAGPMQGNPDGPGTYGLLPNGGPAYPAISPLLGAADRLPQQPLVPRIDSNGNRQLLLFIELRKLPTQAAVGNVVANLRDLGLASKALETPPAGREWMSDASLDAKATGNWRIIIHTPSGEGAPPAPSMYYPEALNALDEKDGTLKSADYVALDDPAYDPAAPKVAPTVEFYQEFWGSRAATKDPQHSISGRFAGWDRWVRAAWTANPAAGSVHIPAEAADGIIPMPFFLLNPRLYELADGITPNKRRDVGARLAFVGSQFFDPAAMWENRALDPDAGPVERNADFNAEEGFLKRLPTELPGRNVAANQPIEIVVRSPDTDAEADPWTDNYQISGLNTTRLHTHAAEQWTAATDTEPVLDLGAVGRTDSPLTLADGKKLAKTWLAPGDAPVLVVNLLDGRYQLLTTAEAAALPSVVESDDTAWKGVAVPREVSAGVGQVELQFEYETAVPVEYVEDEDHLEWRHDANVPSVDPLGGVTFGEWPFGLDNQPFTADDAAEVATWNLRAPNPDDVPNAIPSTVTDGALVDFMPNIVRPTSSNGTDGGGVDFTYLRDPRLTDRGTDGALTHEVVAADPAVANSTDNVWRIRRFSGWPYNPHVVGVSQTDIDAKAYQGGPLVCRFMVSPITVQPQVTLVADPADPTATTPETASYDLTAAPERLYPQFMLAGDKAFTRPNFLLGYLPSGGLPLNGEDYFYPINPGSRSASARVFVQTVLNHLPGGSNLLWLASTSAAHADQVEFSGARTLRNLEDDPYLGFDFTTHLDDIRTDPEGVLAAPAPSMMLYWYDLARSATTEAVDPDTGLLLRDQDLYPVPAAAAPLDARKAFDGRTVGTEPDSVRVEPQRYLGRMFSTPTQLDRLDLFVGHEIAGADFPTGWETDWQAQYLVGMGTDTDWHDLPAFDSLGGGLLTVEGPRAAVRGIRIKNVLPVPDPPADPADPVTENARLVAELRPIVLRDIRHQVDMAPTVLSTRVSPDPDIPDGVVPASAVRLTGAAEREFSVDHDNLTSLDLSVEVPRYQPPSRDATERQLRADRGQPIDYETWVDPSGNWDRYRGAVRIYVDDTRGMVSRPVPRDDPNDTTIANPVLDENRVGAQAKVARGWDASLYTTPDNGTQFVRWYNETTGNLADAADPDEPNPLVANTGGQQRVAVEPYAGLDLEFSVAYERRLRVAEQFVDFGKTFGGGVSQWVPMTVMNEGNVPVHGVKFYVSEPLRQVMTSDGASRGRAVSLNPIPSQLPQRLALGEAGENGLIQVWGQNALTSVYPSRPGEVTGRRVGSVYLRLGRNDLPAPYRVPVGQPMGNYTGKLTAFVDNLGTADPADVPGDGTGEPTLEKLATGGVAVLKATLAEGPLARVADLMDNDQDRRLESDDPLNVAPYDLARTPPGTFQPVPVFEFYSDPNVPDATPALVVAQDPQAPREGDGLAVVWARQIPSAGGGPGPWDVFMQTAGRPTLPAGVIAETNYRGFEWPTTPTAPVNIGQAPAGTRNVYPSIAPVPGAPDPEFVVLWHNEGEQAATNRRASALQFMRVAGGTQGPLLSIADDEGGTGLVNKALPRGVVDSVNGGGKVLWVAWQDGQGGRSTLGLNAIAMPDDPAATTGYADAIAAGAPVQNYRLHTPPGLTNLAEPWLLASYRHPATNESQATPDPRMGNLQRLNAFYSAWSPLWQNEDIYWTRYRALQDPDESTVDPATDWVTGLADSPMAEDGYRLSAVDGGPGEITWAWPTAADQLTLTTLPGGRVPQARITDELLRALPENNVYGSYHPDWVLPGPQPRVSYIDPGAAGVRRVESVNHQGFADTVLPIVDHEPDGTAVPLFELRIFEGANVTAGPPDLSDPANVLLDVAFNLEQALWDETELEWVLPFAPSP
ncbi:MAG TPA: hypothetical protein DCZ72_13785, partial [Armatimonadetes bacterium]|nr:hypothetical protein [Armatimonadota bacterium]